MALDSLGVGKRVGLGFAVSVFVLLILVLTSYFQLGRVAAAPALPTDMKDLAASGQNLVLILGVLGGLVICAAGFFCTRGVGAVFGRPIGRLSDCTSSIDLAVNQMTASSQLLADGTTGQAGDLEETASAVEELSSLTRSNADNTKEADTIMTSAREAFAEADSSIQKLTTSMGDITAASEQTQKIVKTIDEIAFQTNLLALNAAVEAARAGEAGAGFAVVADEVRNLAMRAADAAKDTSVMIDATVNKVQGGTALVNETNELFYMASKASERVGALIAEIATASEEQASGIDQIGKTIHDMDQRTQGLAATSEESASASITLRGQVAGLDKIAGELLGLTGQKAAGFSPQRQRAGVAAPVSRSNAMMPKPAAGKPPVKQLPPAPAKTKSEDVIPFDDDDFEDF